jgi:hypothetical protein
MDEQTRKPAPRRIFRLTFTKADGTRHWRYIRCPYQVKSPEDWADSLVGVQTALSEYVLEGAIRGFAIGAVAPERTRAAAERSDRFSEIDFPRLIAA